MIVFIVVRCGGWCNVHVGWKSDIAPRAEIVQHAAGNDDAAGFLWLVEQGTTGTVEAPKPKQ